jgi:flagellar protein FliO/FliZ
MFQSLFSAEMPLAVRFFLAFLIVLGLIGATAWAVRRFGTGRLGSSSSRGRQPRLAVIDYASVDARRRLILVRRDNVEHLVMIGGPTDVVVESNIVRAMAAPREVTAPRPPGAVEPLPRAIPLPENGNGSWPLHPEATPTPAPARPVARIEPASGEPVAWSLQPHPETPKRPQRDTLAALAEELSARPTPSRGRAPLSPRVQPLEPRVEPRAEQPPAETPTETAAEPRTETRDEPPVAPVQPESAETASADKSLAEMAQRLEAALRKPGAAAVAPPPRPRAPDEQAAAPIPPVPPRTARPEPKMPRPEAKPSQSKTLYDSLEQEMASLLGRPTNKT